MKRDATPEHPSHPAESQIGKICALSLREGGVVTVVLVSDVKIRPWENCSAQRWKIEAAHDGLIGFRNMSNGNMLGIGDEGTVHAANLFSCEEESFRFEEVEPIGEGARLFMLRRGSKTHCLVRPSLEDYLVVSRAKGYSTPLIITYLT